MTTQKYSKQKQGGFSGILLAVGVIVSQLFSSSSFAGAKALMPTATPGQTSIATPVVSSPSLESQPLSLKYLSPQELTVPSFTSDFSSAVMTPELMSQLEDQYVKQLESFSLHNGFYIPSQDSRVVRPFQLSIAQETQIREDMARSVKQYMLLRGLPRFLSSRSSTRNVGQAYAKTVETVTSATKVEVKTKNNWAFSTGVNAFTMKAWSHISNNDWNFEMNNDLTHFDTNFVMARKFGRLVTATTFTVSTANLQPAVIYNFSPTLSGRFESNIATKNAGWISNSNNLVSMSYTF